MLLLLAGCGGGGGKTDSAATQGFQGAGYRAQAPEGWALHRGLRSVTARDGSALISVTVFPLTRSVGSVPWVEVVDETDQRVKQLAARERRRVANGRTTAVGGARARVYDLTGGASESRIAFVFRGRREYQLFCRRSADDACDLLFSSFRIAA